MQSQACQRLSASLVHVGWWSPLPLLWPGRLGADAFDAKACHRCHERALALSAFFCHGSVTQTIPVCSGVHCTGCCSPSQRLWSGKRLREIRSKSHLRMVWATVLRCAEAPFWVQAWHDRFQIAASLSAWCDVIISRSLDSASHRFWIVHPVELILFKGMEELVPSSARQPQRKDNAAANRIRDELEASQHQRADL